MGSRSHQELQVLLPRILRIQIRTVQQLQEVLKLENLRIQGSGLDGAPMTHQVTIFQVQDSRALRVKALAQEVMDRMINLVEILEDRLVEAVRQIVMSRRQ